MKKILTKMVVALLTGAFIFGGLMALNASGEKTNITPKSTKSTICVPTDYPTIQEAIDNADEGDTIFVYNGIYYENVIINRTINLIGENRENTVIDGNNTGDVIHVSGANWVHITGFTIKNSGHYPVGNIGINLFYPSNNNTITNCNIYSNEYGIALATSYNNIVKNCVLWNNLHGLHFSWSSKNNITNCTIYNNSYNGIGFWKSACNVIKNCHIYSNYYDGIEFSSSSNNTVISCEISLNNEHGIAFWQSSSGNVITNCNISNNNCSIALWMFLGDVSSNNYIHHNNFINNTNQPYDDCSNYWDDCVSEGNYWSNYNGNDGDSDGVGDMPYIIPGGNNQDSYPLMNPMIDAGYNPSLVSDISDVNNPPALSNGTVSPLYGYLDTVFKFNVIYTDEDGDEPVYVNVIIDGDAHNMTKQNISDSDYTDGCVYEYSTTLSKGFHSYSFEALDERNATSTWPVYRPIYGIKVTEKERGEAWAPESMYYFVLIGIIIAVEIVGSVIFLKKRKKTMTLRCPKCSTVFKVKRKKEPFKVECPTCGAVGTIGKPKAEEKILPEKTAPTRTLRCPKCKQTFTVEEKEKPFSVKCPHCGNEGTIR